MEKPARKGATTSDAGTIGAAQHWRETRLLKSEELELFDNVKFAPLIFQE